METKTMSGVRTRPTARRRRAFAPKTFGASAAQASRRSPKGETTGPRSPNAATRERGCVKEVKLPNEPKLTHHRCVLIWLIDRDLERAALRPNLASFWERNSFGDTLALGK